MARRPEIPEDVFFDTSEDNGDAKGRERASKRDAAEGERSGGGPRSYRRVRDEEPDESSSRVGRPPAQEGPKTAVTLYLTEPVAHRLEEARFLLLTEHGVKTSKSAIADFAIRHGLDDLAAAADDLRRA